jgi:hypothetical protein
LKLQLSQGHLNLLAVCPRKFQHLFLDQLGLPQDFEQQEHLVLGAQFHQLMQQQELALPIAPLVEADPLIKHWFESFEQTPPNLIEGKRQSEQTCTLWLDDYLLIAIYDLLIEGQNQAQILDWKTYTRPQVATWLQENWQTRLYSFILAETSEYLPEQIAMTYWFAEGRNHQAATHSLTFTYSSAQHEQTRQDLKVLLDQLTLWLALYDRGQDFPQVAFSRGQCVSDRSQCSFAVRCDRQSSKSENLAANCELQTNLDHIPEIPVPITPHSIPQT